MPLDTGFQLAVVDASAAAVPPSQEVLRHEAWISGEFVTSVASDSQGLGFRGSAVQLSVVNPAGFVLAAATVRRTSLVGTTFDSVVSGADVGGALRLELRQQRDDVRFNLRLETAGLSASLVHQAVQFLRRVQVPNRLRFSTGGVDLQTLDVPAHAPPLDPDWVDAVRALAFVQRETAVKFDLPDLDAATIRTIRRAERLLRGATVSGRWTDVKLQTADAQLAEVFADGQLCRFECDQEYVVDIGGHRVVLGNARFTLNSSHLSSGPELSAGSGLFAVELRPGNADDAYSVELIDPPGSSIGDPFGSPVALDDEFLARATG